MIYLTAILVYLGGLAATVYLTVQGYWPMAVLVLVVIGTLKIESSDDSGAASSGGEG